MTFTIIYHGDVLKEDIPKLDKKVKVRIKKEIERKPTFRPEVFGKPLRWSIKGYRKLRVGNYRVIFRIESKKVKIFAIEHRSVVYKKVAGRIE